MLGLRYFACQRCATVFALPEPPQQCGRCAHDCLTELSAEGTGSDYFAPAKR